MGGVKFEFIDIDNIIGYCIRKTILSGDGLSA